MNIRELYLTGHTVPELAKRFYYTERHIRLLLYGLIPRTDYSALMNDWNDGMNSEDIIVKYSYKNKMSLYSCVYKRRKAGMNFNSRTVSCSECRGTRCNNCRSFSKWEGKP